MMEGRREPHLRFDLRQFDRCTTPLRGPAKLVTRHRNVRGLRNSIASQSTLRSPTGNQMLTADVMSKLAGHQRSNSYINVIDVAPMQYRCNIIPWVTKPAPLVAYG
jgi:hypothetical protein